MNESINSEEIYNIINEVELAEKEHDVDLQILKNIELADIFTKIYEKEQALYYLNKALLLSNKFEKKENLNIIYHKIGDLYLLNNNYESAKEYFLNAYKLSILQSEGENSISDLMKLGFVVHKQNDLDSARYYYKKILKIVDANDSKETLPLIYSKLAEIYEDEGLFNEAKLLYKQGIDTSYYYKINTNIDLLYLSLGRVYSGLNIFDSAQIFLKKCDSVIKTNNNLELKTECNYWLLRNEIMQEPNNELLERLDYNKIKNDSIGLQMNAKWRQYAEFNYKLGKKEADLKYLQVINRNQQLKYIFIIVILLLVVIIVAIFIINRNKKLKQELTLISKENEIKKLKEKQLQEEASLIKRELEIKNKEVLSNSLILMNKNEVLKSIKNKVNNIQVNDNNKLVVNEILSLLRDSTNQDNIWNDFKIHFEKVHQDFFNKLKEKHPDLSENDIRLCAYLLIGMQNQEIANISFISPESVRKRKQRLKERLGLELGKDLVKYIKSI